MAQQPNLNMRNARPLPVLQLTMTSAVMKGLFAQVTLAPQPLTWPRAMPRSFVQAPHVQQMMKALAAMLGLPVQRTRAQLRLIFRTQPTMLPSVLGQLVMLVTTLLAALQRLFAHLSLVLQPLMWPRAMTRFIVLLLIVQQQMMKALAAMREMFAQLSLAPRRPMSTRSARPTLCAAGRRVVRMNAVMTRLFAHLSLALQPLMWPRAMPRLFVLLLHV